MKSLITCDKPTAAAPPAIEDGDEPVGMQACSMRADPSHVGQHFCGDRSVAWLVDSRRTCRPLALGEAAKPSSTCGVATTDSMAAA
jgi:hypothetical protein